MAIEERLASLVTGADDLEATVPQGGKSDPIDLGDGVMAYPEDELPEEEVAEEQEADDDFYENLAEVLPEKELDKLASKYLELIERDDEQRATREKRKAEALDKSGLAGPAPGGADFDGSSKVTQPVYAEARLDFSASIMRELFPVTGPFAVKVPEKADRARLEKADRKVRYLNQQAINNPSFISAAYERAIYELPDSGSSFVKHVWSEADQMLESNYAPLENTSLPPMVVDFYKSPRVFDKVYLNKYEFQRRQRQGVYRKLPKEDEDKVAELDLNSAEEARLQKAGSDIPETNEDGIRVVYEGIVIDDEIEDDRSNGAAVSYIMILDEATSKVLALYRHYDPETLETLPRNFTKIDFVPGPDAFGYSLYDLIGGIQTSVTGITRALIDAGFSQTAPMLLRLKGPGAGQNITLQPNMVVDVSDATVDDIRKVFMQVSLGAPSPTLMSLLEHLTTSAKGVVSTAEEQITQNSSRMPIGTAMALLEAGSKIYSSIHVRVYNAFKQTCVIVQRLHYHHLPEEKFQYGPNEEDFVLRSDFEDVEDIVPASDPQIFSEAQRGMQAQVVMGLAEKYPTIVNQLNAVKRYLKLLRVPNYEELLPPSQETALHPVAENVSMASGKFYPAFPPQDHLAHIQVHLDFLTSPILGMSMTMFAQVFPLMLQHINQHIVYLYAVMMQEAATQIMGEPVEKALEERGQDWEGAAEIDRILAQVSPQVTQATNQVLGQVVQIMQKLQEQMMQLAPPPKDPAVIQAEGYQQQVQVLAENNKMDFEAQMKKLQLAAQELQQKGKQFLLDMQKDRDEAILKAQTDLRKNSDDNDTSLAIAAMREETNANSQPQNIGEYNG